MLVAWRTHKVFSVSERKVSDFYVVGKLMAFRILVELFVKRQFVALNLFLNRHQLLHAVSSRLHYVSHKDHTGGLCKVLVLFVALKAGLGPQDFLLTSPDANRIDCDV